MKTLYLVRHAKSDWGNPEISDKQRTLNQRGLRVAPMMGKKLAEQGIQMDVILSSPATRAITTARLIAEQLHYDELAIIQQEALYNADPNTLLNAINHIDDQHNSAMLVAHNPGISDLASLLSHELRRHMPTCTIVSIEFAVDTWQAVCAGGGKQLAFDIPAKQ